METKTILLIEDEIDLANEIELTLNKWGFNICKIDEFDKILSEFLEKKPQLVLLDINLPFYDGFYWCKKIRGMSKVPIIFLSSRNSNMDMIMGINDGADDYITKPFSTDILITKINALLRRSYDYSISSNILFYDGLALDTEKGIVTYNEKSLELTKNDMKILSTLIKNKGKIVSRENLMMSLWNENEFVNENTLTVSINRLRNKILELGLKDFIKTKKGIGYII
ncbi:DNA-binding response regulator [Clostridium gelidum]|uniref:Stage 0 sporulation protein A homolog n=1 Tax=Clostridium gelidum TaxID=704125 RepID=A0ABM7TBD3_9CLOT|nr:response regulator transcription factor [Clostridium gelidum]BCZ46287.1 DNA-binding response regulator [Clostridium gelidum]